MDSGNEEAGSSSSKVKEIDKAEVNSTYELYEEVQKKQAAVDRLNRKIAENKERKLKAEKVKKQLEDLKELKKPLLKKLADIKAAAANKQEWSAWEADCIWLLLL